MELCRFLEKLGVGVHGIGTTTIQVEGCAKRHGGDHRLWGDYIEAGSWAVVAAVTDGRILHADGLVEGVVRELREGRPFSHLRAVV